MRRWQLELNIKFAPSCACSISLLEKTRNESKNVIGETHNPQRTPALCALMLSRFATEHPPVKRPKLADDGASAGQVRMSAAKAEVKLGPMPEGQEILRKRKLYLG